MDATTKKRKYGSRQMSEDSGCSCKGPIQWKKCLYPDMYKDDSLTIGGRLKAKGEVLVEQDKARGKAPNTNCRIEKFVRICNNIGDTPRRWVQEMGFGGLLLFLGDMVHLPRQLSYWLMSRVDPFSGTLRARDGRVFRISPNQVHWVLGIPNGGKDVPTYNSVDKDKMRVVDDIISLYGKTWTSKSSKTGKEYKSFGVPVNSKLIERLEGNWDDSEEVNFKTLFLAACLEMLLCPTQSSRLAADLVPALTCASSSVEFDWCSLVVKKLMESVVSFSRRFYTVGYGNGCGGCLYFLVVMYLDRLDRVPVNWCCFPRLAVWGMREMRRAINEDRFPGGDFGVVGTLDVAYGEAHPLEARDTDGPLRMEQIQMG